MDERHAKQAIERGRKVRSQREAREQARAKISTEEFVAREFIAMKEEATLLRKQERQRRITEKVATRLLESEKKKMDRLLMKLRDWRERAHDEEHIRIRSSFCPRTVLRSTLHTDSPIPPTCPPPV